MDKKIKNLYIVLILLLTIGSCFLFYRTRLAQIINPEDYIRSCTDFGQYFIEIKDYTSGDKITDLMKVAEEPWFFLIASSFVRITGISERSVLSIFSMIMYCLTSFIVAILPMKIIRQKKNIYCLWILSVLIYISFYWNINAQIAGIWRQILSQMYILLVLLISFYANNYKTRLIGGLFIGMCIISHTFSMITILGTYACLIFFNLIFGKKKYEELKKNVIILLLWIILTLPYVYYVYLGYIHNYAIYLFEYMTWLNIKTVAWVVEGTNDYTEYLGEKNTGFNFLGPKANTISPLLFYYLNFSSVIIVLLSNLKKLTISLNNDTYRVYFLVILLYTSMKIDFATRGLLTLELVILPIVILAIEICKNWKLNKILNIIGIFFIWFLSISNLIITKNYTKNISQDKSISYIRDNFSHKNNVYFMSNTTCTADLMSEIGVNNGLNYHLKLTTAQEDKANGELDFTRVLRITSNNVRFLEQRPILFEFFRDKDVYIVITERDGQVLLNRIKLWEYPLLNKPYIELIYSNTEKNASIKYIFRVKKNEINYTDNPNYIYENMNVAPE